MAAATSFSTNDINWLMIVSHWQSATQQDCALVKNQVYQLLPDWKKYEKITWCPAFRLTDEAKSHTATAAAISTSSVTSVPSTAATAATPATAVTHLPSSAASISPPIAFVAYCRQHEIDNRCKDGDDREQCVLFDATTHTFVRSNHSWKWHVPKAYSLDCGWTTVSRFGYPVTIVACQYTGIYTFMLSLDQSQGCSTGSLILCATFKDYQEGKRYIQEQVRPLESTSTKHCDDVTCYAFDSSRLMRRWEQWYDEGQWPTMQQLGLAYDNKTDLKETWTLGTVFVAPPLPASTNVVQDVFEFVNQVDQTFTCDVCQSQTDEKNIKLTKPDERNAVLFDDVFFCVACTRLDTNRDGFQKAHTSNACKKCKESGAACPRCHKTVGKGWQKGDAQVVTLLSTQVQAMCAHNAKHQQLFEAWRENDELQWNKMESEMERLALTKVALKTIRKFAGLFSTQVDDYVVQTTPRFLFVHPRTQNASGLLLSLCALARHTQWLHVCGNRLPTLVDPLPRLLIISVINADDSRVYDSLFDQLSNNALYRELPVVIVSCTVRADPNNLKEAAVSF